MLQQCFVWRVFVAVSHHKTNTWVTGKPFISKKCRLDVSFWPKSKPVTCQVSHSPTPLRWKSLATTSRVVVGVATLYAVDRCFASILARLSITFPSSLAGMLFTFISLLALQKVELYSKSVSEHIFDWFLPSVQFLARWLAVFFVPNLVLLPLFPVKDPLEVLRMVILVVVCLIATLLFTAYVASFLSVKERLWNQRSSSAPPAVASKTDPPSAFITSFWSISSVANAVGLYSLMMKKRHFSSVLFYCYSLSTTLTGFCLGQRVPSSVKRWMHPITFCTVFTISALFLISRWIAIPFDVALNTYLRRGVGWWRITEGGSAGNLLLTFLSPAVVSFAFQMYSRRKYMQQYMVTLLLSCTLASLFGLFSTAFMAKVLQLAPIARVSLIPRSITVPLAVAISSMLHGSISLTSTAVAVTGILGTNVNKELLSLLGIYPFVARGIAVGASSHGLGTAAMAEEPEAFPFAAISMTLVATISTILTSFPIIRRWLLLVAGLPCASFLK
jgi:putative effector of murein hydrolase